MQLETHRKRRHRLSMTSLIDVIFLLLLFFMLTSTFSKFGEIELATAAAGEGAKPDRTIRFVKLERDRLLIDGTPVALNEAASLFKGKSEETALISLGPSASSQQLIDLLIILHAVDQLNTQVIG